MNYLKILNTLVLPFILLPLGAQPKLTPNHIDAVVKAMTLDEKAALLVGFMRENSYFGMPTAASEHTHDLMSGAAGQTTNIDRLSIPNVILADGPAGLRIDPIRGDDKQTYYCTGFPVGICLSSSWDGDLVQQVTAAMGNEVREYGADILLAPGMNIQRNALCGRNFEYFSEDPLLTGKIAAAYIRGVQSNGVGVTVKHLAVNNQESNRVTNDPVVSQRALREIYLKGFEIAIREAAPWAVMSSYNKVGGVFASENPELLTTVLRDEWGFCGLVMTDWAGPRNTAAQVHAGNDLMMPGDKKQIEHIVTKVQNGELEEKDVDLSVKRLLECIVRTPHYQKYVFSNKPDLKAHAAITRKAAADCMVLLKNDNQTLPFEQSVKNISLFGVTSYHLRAGGAGSGDVHKAYVINMDDGLENAGYEINKGLSKLYESYQPFGTLARDMELGDVAKESFFVRQGIAEPDFSSKIYKACACQSDLAVITLGRYAGEAADRHLDGDFNLTVQEQNLISGVCDAFHQAGKKVVVVLNVAGVIETASWKERPDAILLAWLPGQEAGNSITDILTGAIYPAGKLPVTFPVNYMDDPSSANFPQDYFYRNDWEMSAENKAKLRAVATTFYQEDIYVGYRYYESADKAVSYPFGYGLGYTTFIYSDAKILKKGNKYIATVSVKNNGGKAGKEIVELYVSAPEGILEKPALELKAFAKTKELRPGEVQTLELTFDNYDLASYDESLQAWVTEAGTYQARFGASVSDIRFTLPFKVKAGNVQCHPVLAPDQPLERLSLRQK